MNTDHIDVYPVILEIIENLMGERAHFTAFTVTLKVREKMNDQEIPHYELVRPATHAVMNALLLRGSSTYVMSLDHTSFASPAWVYHPKGESPKATNKNIPMMIPVESTAIEAVGFEIDVGSTNGTLWITFTSGGTYQFKGVPVHHFIGLLNADSKGGYYNQNVRPFTISS